MIYDVIILGAGLVGLTEALLCAKKGLTVALVDRRMPILTWPVDSYDLRCSAISPGSQRIFASIGVWDHIERDRVSAFDQMKVWDAQGHGEIAFHAAEVFEPNLGHIIENRVMIKSLWNAVQEQSLISAFMNVTPMGFSKDNKQICLTLSDQQSLSAKVLVGADGAESWLRQTANFTTSGWDYQQKALVTVVKTERSHEKTAWQRFLKEGPLAFLPLSDPYLSSIVWSTSKERADQLMALSEDDFCEALAIALDYRLGKIISHQQLQLFPLRAQRSVQRVGDRVVLIGDAAQVIHPLAGQGVNLGLQDAEVLSQVLFQAKVQDYDLGHYLVLRRYERARAGSAKMYLRATDFLKRFFALPYYPISIVRSVGVNLVSRIQLLKKEIMYQAMGISKSL